ncbi:MAG: hypothetical protein SGJ10_08910 [Bacteroidota bacterium]|nr:hypothetical protein [Bacteroidota bacterium]
MKQYETFLIILFLIVYFSSSGQIQQFSKATNEYATYSYTEKLKTITKKEVFQFCFCKWQDKISHDSLVDLYIREFKTKEYDIVKNNPKAYQIMKKEYHDSVPLYKGENTIYCSEPIANSWNNYDIVNERFDLNIKNELVYIYNNAIHNRKMRYGLKLEYGDYEFPLKLKLNKKNARKFTNAKTSKNAQSKWVTNKNIYLVYIYSLDNNSFQSLISAICAN